MSSYERPGLGVNTSRPRTSFPTIWRETDVWRRSSPRHRVPQLAFDRPHVEVRQLGQPQESVQFALQASLEALSGLHRVECLHFAAARQGRREVGGLLFRRCQLALQPLRL
jgi:hypothetical protein